MNYCCSCNYRHICSMVSRGIDIFEIFLSYECRIALLLFPAFKSTIPARFVIQIGTIPIEISCAPNPTSNSAQREAIW